MNMQNGGGEAPQQKKGGYVMMGMIALFFSWIIMKEVTIPKYLLAMGFVFGGLYLLIRGLGRPELITYILVAYIPFSRQLAGDFGGMVTAFNLTNLLLGFQIFVWVSGKYQSNEPAWLRSPLNLPIALFMLFGFIAVVRGNYYGAGFIGEAIINYKRWITPMFFYFLVLNTVKDRIMIRNISITMMIVVTIAALMAIYDYINVGNVSSLEKARVGGIVNQPNMLAAFFNYYMFLPFGFFLLNMNRFKYWTLLVPFLICFRGIMVTFSRGGYLAFAFALFAITFFRSKLLFILLVTATCIVYFNPVILPAGIRYRMGQTVAHQSPYMQEELSEESLEGSSKTRVEIWKAGMQMVKDNPMFGVGYDLFPYRLKEYMPVKKVTDAHNTYLIIAAEMGIPALIIFLWILLRIFLSAFRLYRTTQDRFAKGLALGFIGGLFGLLMSNMFGSRLDSQEISSYLFILAAMMERLYILDRREAAQGIIPSGPVPANVTLSPKIDGMWRHKP